MKFRTLIALLLAAPAAFATPTINGFEQKDINGSNNYMLNLTDLAESGKNGVFTFRLNGNFSLTEATEYARYQFNGREDLGSLELSGFGTEGVKFNNIDGLTKTSFTYSGSGDDMDLTWTFALSDSLLNSLIADKAIHVNVNLSDAVTGKKDEGKIKDKAKDSNQASKSNDFVSVGLGFEAADSAPAASTPATQVPEPASLALSGLGLGLLALARRRRKLV